jgi:serine/threonine protein phosphatase 1
MTALDLTNSLVYQANVFRRRTRKLPLAEAVTRVEPSHILPRRSAVR